MLLLIAVHTVLLVQYVHGEVHVHEGVPVRSVPGVLQVLHVQRYTVKFCLIKYNRVIFLSLSTISLISVFLLN